MTTDSIELRASITCMNSYDWMYEFEIARRTAKVDYTEKVKIVEKMRKSINNLTKNMCFAAKFVRDWEIERMSEKLTSAKADCNTAKMKLDIATAEHAAACAIHTANELTCSCCIEDKIKYNKR
jgi:hypothetical protein